MASSVGDLFTTPGTAGIGFVYRNKSYPSASAALQAYINEFDGEVKYKQFQSKYNYTPPPQKNGGTTPEKFAPRNGGQYIGGLNNAPQQNWNLLTPVKMPSVESVASFDCMSCTPDMTRFEGIEKVEGVPKWVAEMDPPISRKYLRGHDDIGAAEQGFRNRAFEPGVHLTTPDTSVRPKMKLNRAPNAYQPGGVDGDFGAYVADAYPVRRQIDPLPDSVSDLRRERLERSNNIRKTKSHVSLDDASDVTYTPSAIAKLFPDDERALEISMRIEEFRSPGRRRGGRVERRAASESRLRSRSLSSSSRTPIERPRSTTPGVGQRAQRRLFDDEMQKRFDEFDDFNRRPAKPPLPGKRISDSTVRTCDTEFLLRQPALPSINPSDVLSSPTKSMEYLFPPAKASNHSSPDTEEVLSGDRPWEKSTSKLTEIKTGLSFIDSPKRSVMDMFLESCGPAGAAEATSLRQGPPSSLNSSHQARPVESLKNMLFQMQTVASATEELTQSAVTSANDIKNSTQKRKDDFDLSTSTQELLNVIENKNGAQSLEKAMHHLNKLQGLMTLPN